MTTEHSKLVGKVLKHLNSLPQCTAFPVRPGPWGGKKGTSDIIFCYKGLFGSSEVKVGYDKPTKLQNIFMRKVKEAKGDARVSRTIEDIKQQIKSMEEKSTALKVYYEENRYLN